MPGDDITHAMRNHVIDDQQTCKWHHQTHMQQTVQQRQGIYSEASSNGSTAQKSHYPPANHHAIHL